MSDVWYWAILERNKAGRYFAHVPDLPGATAAGASEGEVLQAIAEIATDHVRDLVEDGHVLPPSRNSREIEHDPEVKEYLRAAIPIDVPGRSTKISLSIDEALLRRADRAANTAGMSRSGFFAAAVTDKIAGIRAATDMTAAIKKFDLADLVQESLKRTRSPGRIAGQASGKVRKSDTRVRGGHSARVKAKS
jgi:predicted RNase H-like HicB family nuclease